MLSNIDFEDIVYMDEMGINKPLYRQYGKSLKGVRVPDTITGKRSERTSIIAGYCNKQLIAPLVFTLQTQL